MAKSDDGPTIVVRLEKGRLVPVSAYDVELLGQWHEGAELDIEAKRVKARPMERRYFAMLSKLLKEADTPWSNTVTAHEALKLATGFVTPVKRKTGKWESQSRHIASFTDEELSEFFELFCGIVRERFGIDPDTLQKESSDTGSSRGSASHGAEPDDAPGTGPIPAGVGEPTPPAANSADGAPEAGNEVESTPRGPLSARGPHLGPGELDWLKMTARMLVAATEPGGELAVVDRQVKAIKAHLTPASISPEAKEIAQLIYRHCRAVTRGDRPLDAKWVAYTAGCNPADLRAEAR